MSVDGTPVDFGTRSGNELLVGAVVAVSGLAVAAFVATAEPLPWLGGTLVPAVALFGYAGARLPENRPPGAEGIRPTLGLANSVTLFRGVLVCGVAGFALASPSWAWLPVALFVAAGLLDAVDGAIARRTRTTTLGRRLDGAVDALAVLLGGVAAVSLGGIPAWYLLAGVVWYAYAGSLWLRRRRGKSVYELPPSRLRAPIGAAQLVVVAAALTPLAPHPLLTIVAAIALLALLASFVRDWGAATGRPRFRPDTP